MAESTQLVRPVDPPWFAYAKTKVGVHELPGFDKDDPYIVECIKDAGLPSKYWHDETFWCGCFANKCLITTGHKGPPGPAAARHWTLPCKQLVQLAEPCNGCILVFSRPPKPTSGHVGFYDEWTSSFDSTHLYYAVLGGNEDNSVKTKRYPRNRYIGSYWPADYPLPEGVALFEHLVADLTQESP
jgi:uncharacterized protein (TIGR02594 family)